METTEVLSLIENAVRNVVNNKTLPVNADSLLVDDLGLESIDLLDVSSELENGIGKELDFREVAEFVKQKSGRPVNMKSLKVGDLVEYIQSAH